MKHEQYLFMFKMLILQWQLIFEYIITYILLHSLKVLSRLATRNSQSRRLTTRNIADLCISPIIKQRTSQLEGLAKLIFTGFVQLNGKVYWTWPDHLLNSPSSFPTRVSAAVMVSCALSNSNFSWVASCVRFSNLKKILHRIKRPV